MFKRVGFVAALLIFLAACHRTVPGSKLEPWTPDQALAREVGELATRAERLIRAQDEIVWKHWTEGAPLDLSAHAAEQRALYTREALDRIDALRRRTHDPERARSLELLRTHFAGEYVALATATQQEAFDALRTTLTFEVDGEVHPLRDLERLLARERNALTRQALHQAAAEAVKKLGPASERLDRALDEALLQAGYRTKLDWAAALRRTRPERVVALAETILRETEDAFRRVLEQLATRELRLPIENVRARDLPRMFRTRDADELFPAEQVASRGESLARGLGIDLSSVVKLDGGDHPQKNPRPLAIALHVPDDVRLSFRPSPGIHAQSRYLAELGHALHAAHTAQPDFARSRLGGGAVSRAFSQLFGDLIADRSWLEEEIGLSGERLNDHVSSAAAWDLYLLRRHAGQLLFTVARWKGEQASYSEIMARALGVPFEEADRDHFLLLDRTLPSATWLEAAVLQQQLRAQLKQRFGPTWWEKKEAGDLLRSLWARGTAPDAEELARALGDEGLSPGPLLLWLEQAPAPRPR